MKNASSRRNFLRTSALVSSGIALLSTPVGHALTPHESSQIRTCNLGTTWLGDHIRVTGTIFKKSDLTPVSNAEIEIWHLTSGSRKTNLQGHLTTNADGTYSIITDFPKREPGKMARIHFKVISQNKSYNTSLILSELGAFISEKHWEENQELQEKLFPRVEHTWDAKQVQFNISI